MPGVVYTGGPGTFPSELELLRNYLNKDHNVPHEAIRSAKGGHRRRPVR